MLLHKTLYMMMLFDDADELANMDLYFGICRWKLVMATLMDIVLVSLDPMANFTIQDPHNQHILSPVSGFLSPCLLFSWEL